MDMEPHHTTTTTTRGRRQPAAFTDVEPKACATCRLAHVSCDRKQPCGRCVRLGKTDSCQPPPTRKRGRPPRNKAPPPEQPHTATLAVPPHHHHHAHDQHQPQPHTMQAASKRLCVWRKTSNPVVANSQPSHAAPAPAASSHCFSSTTLTTSPSSSSLSPPVAVDEGQQRQQDSQEQEGLRSLLTLVVDQVREMRRENERLHDSITQLHATQDEMQEEAERLRNTVAELLVGQREAKRMEQDQQQTRTEIERRLARVEQDHQTTNRCELAQTGAELNHTCAPSLWSSLVVADVRPPAIPPRLDAESSSCVGMPLVSAGAPATSRAAEVKRFIAQTLPFLLAFDQSSLILRDLQRPFAVMHMNEFETLDDLVPIIVYASPALCKLLGYNQAEMHGFPKTSFYQVDQEFLPRLVHIVLTPSPTPVSQPLWATGGFDTKHGRSVRVSTQHQVLFNHRRKVGSIEMGLDSTPLTTPSPSDIINQLTARAIARVQLLALLPQALLKGRRTRGRVLTTTIRRADAPDSHHQAFVEHGLVGELSTQESLTTGQQQRDETTTTQPVELRADAELEELIRVLGRSLSQRSSGVPSPQMMVGFSSTRPPPTPSSLAERWMRC